MINAGLDFLDVISISFLLPLKILILLFGCGALSSHVLPGLGKWYGSLMAILLLNSPTVAWDLFPSQQLCPSTILGDT